MKRARLWLLLVTIMGGAIALGLVRAHRDRPLEISFIGFTNIYQYDQRVALFATTNRSARPLRYAMQIERKQAGNWPVYVGPLPHEWSPVFTVPAGSAFALWTLPPTSNAAWRISLAYSLEDASVNRNGSRLEKLRWRVADFLYAHNWAVLARFFHEGPKVFIAVGPEMHNEPIP